MYACLTAVTTGVGSGLPSATSHQIPLRQRR